MAEKKGKMKGQKKQSPDTASAEDNPLLKIENRIDFSIETSNLLQEPDKLIFPGYETFDVRQEQSPFDTSKLSDSTSIIINLRYYEYLCTATFSMSFIVPLLQSGLSIKDVFDMIKHALRNRLLLNAPTFDSIFEPDFHYLGKIRY